MVSGFLTANDAALNVSAFQEVERGPGGPIQAASFLEAAPDTRLRFWHGSAGGRVREAWGRKASG